MKHGSIGELLTQKNEKNKSYQQVFTQGERNKYLQSLEFSKREIQNKSELKERPYEQTERNSLLPEGSKSKIYKELYKGGKDQKHDNMQDLILQPLKRERDRQVKLRSMTGGPSQSNLTSNVVTHFKKLDLLLKNYKKPTNK